MRGYSSLLVEQAQQGLVVCDKDGTVRREGGWDSSECWLYDFTCMYVM